MRILVTGGAGFIGSHVVSALTEAGHEVRVLDALLPAVHRAAPEVPEHVDFHRGDVRDRDTVAAALRGVDAVSHQAAMVGLGLDLDDAPRYVGCNDLGTAVLLAEMARAGVRRLVLAGSMVVYGEGRYACGSHGRVVPGPRPAADLEAGRFEPRCPRCGAELTPGQVSEEAAPDPRNVYAATKLAQEHLASAWARTVDGTATSLRSPGRCSGRRVRRDPRRAGARFALLGLVMPRAATPYAAVAVLLAAAVPVTRRSDPDRPWSAALTMTGVLLLVLTPNYPWYALLLVALAALDGRVEWLAVAPAGYAVYLTWTLGLSEAQVRVVHESAYGAALLVVVVAAVFRQLHGCRIPRGRESGMVRAARGIRTGSGSG
ncbi:NAD-dependent epimerase/dehydratase family protein [Yinghuangia sp. ASG 101]|uniref:NAD-dependent epimerase/dehydratase family protein n=1 Tax=Yinghuangia sp. ASG 101 TaxID=2896848 RepID=UPI001E422359|nr:NAD-dependent epimerase/dehydratase family protein [Yinghuangia sp. ASG 101]UGQ13459.1 NAD-dependent epimerase/dehydratase family protein [Yinghuangia sp. ASG 101]